MARIRYDAFISYRHSEPDSEIAARLHKKLESFRLPKTVAAKIRKTRLHRVFRDEAELAVSDDLSQAIETALQNSKYLIAVCSPEYLKSVWCQKEITKFLEYSDRKHVLLVLAEGDPENAFPEVLLYNDVIEEDEFGRKRKVRKPHEPLAADCRGANAKERNEKVDNAVIRLVAAMFGVGYDDLMQRHRKEKNMRRTRRTLIAFGILAAVIAICVFFLFKISKQNDEIIKQNDEISRQNEEITRRYADSLAATSDNLLRDGRRKDAIYAARLGLSDEKTDTYSDAATRALTNALGIYAAPDTISPSDDILIPCSANSFQISNRGSFVAVKGLEGTEYLIDTKTQELIFSQPYEINSSSAFDGESGFVYISESGNMHYFDFATHTETDLGIPEGKIQTNHSGDGYMILVNNSLYFYRGSTLLLSDDIHRLGDISERYDVSCSFLSDGGGAWIFITDYERRQAHAFFADLTAGVIYPKVLAKDGLFFCLRSDGNKIVWVEKDVFKSTVYLQDANNPQDVVSVDYQEDIYEVAVFGEDVVVCSDSNLYHLNTNLQVVGDTREIINYPSLMDISDDGIVFMEDSGSVFHIFRAGEHIVARLPIAEASGRISQKVYKNGTIYRAGVGDNHLSSFAIRTSDYVTPYTSEPKQLTYYGIDNPEVKRLKELILQNETEYDSDRVCDVIPCENADICAIQLWDGKAVIYNSKTCERIKTLYADGGYIISFYYDAAREYYYINTKNIKVYDKNFKEIYQVDKLNLYGVDPVSGKPVGSTWGEDRMNYYLINPVTYEELIALADEEIAGYTPDERVKEKYGLE